MKKNEKGLMEVDGSFLTVNDMIKCDTSWTEEVYHDFHSYVRGKMKNSLMGFSSSFGNDLEIPYKPYLALPITVNFKLPTLFSRSSSRDDDIDRLKRFFMEEEGAIAMSQAACFTHRVDISIKAKKVLSAPFQEALKGLFYGT